LGTSAFRAARTKGGIPSCHSTRPFKSIAGRSALMTCLQSFGTRLLMPRMR
jgi:hypothetical protein